MRAISCPGFSVLIVKQSLSPRSSTNFTLSPSCSSVGITSLGSCSSFLYSCRAKRTVTGSSAAGAAHNLIVFSLFKVKIPPVEETLLLFKYNRASFSFSLSHSTVTRIPLTGNVRIYWSVLSSSIVTSTGCSSSMLPHSIVFANAVVHSSRSSVSSIHVHLPTRFMVQTPFLVSVCLQYSALFSGVQPYFAAKPGKNRLRSRKSCGGGARF